MEGRQIFVSQEPTAQFDQIFTKYQLRKLDNVFTKQINISSERYNFFTRKLLKGKPCSTNAFELSLSCDLRSHEESIIRDEFIANLQDGEIQPELLLKEPRSPKKALKLSINIKFFIQN